MILEQIAAGDQSAYLRFGSKGDQVQAVQYALIGLGYDIPDSTTGNFLSQTSAAVVKYKTAQGLQRNDPVVGKGTIGALDTAWAHPFADRDEWLSWQTRLIPDWNYTRQNELDRLNAGASFSFNPISSFLPAAFQQAIVTGLAGLLDPGGSPIAALTPSATWGAGALDLFHCHVVIDLQQALTTPSWSQLRNMADAVSNQIVPMRNQADQAGPEGTPPWTAAYRNLLLASAPPGGKSFNDQTADVLNGLLANSNAEQQPLRIVWHTFEFPVWRPVEVGSNDPRRSWWNDVTPVAGPVTQTPFLPQDFGANVFHMIELGFLVDQNRLITVMATTVDEAAAVVGLDKAQIDAAAAGQP